MGCSRDCIFGKLTTSLRIRLERDVASAMQDVIVDARRGSIRLDSWIRDRNLHFGTLQCIVDSP